eukprot:TRINITY_DN77215_c0_g1_i1.p1 TRINITY_DN77215_c0_g1~~TRINITY_DN77215_c0_g1_i1.p1  ORF type:complete len:295 (-),score=51.98 TRINITY_DN77215_c0_g1_i1:47-931(-)
MGSPDNDIEVDVLTLAGDSIHLDLQSTSKLSQVKELVAVALGVDSRDLKLVRESTGPLVTDSQTLAELGFTVKETLTAIITDAESMLREMLVGQWELLSGTKYFTGEGVLTIESNLQYRGHGYGDLTDGLVRVLDLRARQINLKRIVTGANDHIFVVAEDGATMEGRCPQHGGCWTLRKTSDDGGPGRKINPAQEMALRSALVGEWERLEGDQFFTGHGNLVIRDDLTFSGLGHASHDGEARLEDIAMRRVNLRRRDGSGADHVFVVAEDGRMMQGRCLTIGRHEVRWTLRKVM